MPRRSASHILHFLWSFPLPSVMQLSTPYHSFCKKSILILPLMPFLAASRNPLAVKSGLKKSTCSTAELPSYRSAQPQALSSGPFQRPEAPYTEESAEPPGSGFRPFPDNSRSRLRNIRIRMPARNHPSNSALSFPPHILCFLKERLSKSTEGRESACPLPVLRRDSVHSEQLPKPAPPAREEPEPKTEARERIPIDQIPTCIFCSIPYFLFTLSSVYGSSARECVST